MRTADSPKVVAFPPLVGGLAVLLGIASHHAYAVDVGPHNLFRAAGGIAVVLGPLLALSAVITFARARTNINPGKPALAVVAAGPYRFTRNPMYLALCLLNLGVGLLQCDLVPILLTVPLFAFLHYGVILREERYMTEKFGDAYTSYSKGVRRWV